MEGVDNAPYVCRKMVSESALTDYLACLDGRGSTYIPLMFYVQVTYNKKCGGVNISHMIFSFCNDKCLLAPKYSGASSLEVLPPLYILGPILQSDAPLL